MGGGARRETGGRARYLECRRRRRPEDRFPGGAGSESLEHIPWEEWSRKFEENELAFLYREQKASGEGSTFFRLVRRDGG